MCVRLICAVLLTACYLPGRPDPRVVPEVDDDTGSLDEADTAGGSETPPSDPASPYGQNLVEGGGFEDPDLESWAVDGRCTTTIGTGDLAPPEGEHFLRGMVGIEPMHHCRVSQVIDLDAAGFSPAAVDEGAVAVEAEAMLANRGPEGTYDDQVRLIVRYLASTEGPELGAIETRFAGTSDWSVFGATGLLPEGTRALQVAVEGRFRSPPDNDSYADDVQVWLREVTILWPTSLAQANGRGSGASCGL